ncbi:MAG TPA: ATPase domain-containing protein [Gemmatimonadales bacterium]|nr:ATPase domain-containing protein [Gemmatimonadales bacterium]
MTAAALAVEDRREALAGLRLQLAGVLDRGRSASAALPTGVSALDALLQGGGIPRGRLTEFLGERGSGRTTVVRQMVLQAAAAGHRVAFIDASRTLAPHDWAMLGTYAGAWVIRPADAARGAWCADVLLRTGAFALVVLDGVPALKRSVSVRLTRLAREHDAALVLLGENDVPSQSGGALRLRFEVAAPEGRRRQLVGTERRTSGTGPQPGTTEHDAPAPNRQKRTYSRVATAARAIRIVVEKGGPRQTMEVNRAIPMARRLCAHPEVPDRRRPAAGRGGTRTREGQPAGTSARGQDRQYGHYNRGGGRDDARGKSSRASSGTRRSERPLGRRSA